MDVLVLWKDGSKNIVNSKELKTVKRPNKINVGSEVKMFYVKKWYYGTVLDIENTLSNNIDSGSSDEDEVPLAKLRKLPDSDDLPVSTIVNNNNPLEVSKGKCIVVKTINLI